MRIETDDLTRPLVRALVAEHLAEMRATSPPESTHALEVDALAVPGTTVWTAWQDGELLGCLAVRELPAARGELKCMRTRPAARRRGVAAALVGHALHEARRRGWRELLLETGSQEHFAPARACYARHGFVERGPFDGYVEDPNSVFMSLALRDAR